MKTERRTRGFNPPTCPECGQEMERAEYLEGADGFKSALICVSCPNPRYWPAD